MICALGGALGIALTPPAAAAFKRMVTVFPVFQVSGETLAFQAACALLVALVAAVVPAVRAARIRIVDGLRSIA